MVTFRLPNNPFKHDRRKEHELTPESDVKPVRLSVSLLTFSGFENCTALLSSIHPWFYKLALKDNYI